MVAIDKATSAERREASRLLANALLLGDKESCEVGRTRVYFKVGVLDALEERRALIAQAASTEIVRVARGYLVRRQYVRLLRSVLRLQTQERMRSRRGVFLALRTVAITCQSQRRAVLARRHASVLRRQRAATRLQACQRRRLAVRHLALARGAVVRLQAAFRRWLCRRQYLEDLKSHREQAKLENQVKALQAKLAAQEAASTTDWNVVELQEALNKLTADHNRLRQENERQRMEIATLRRENQQLKEAGAARGEYLDSIKRSQKQGPSGNAPEHRQTASRERSLPEFIARVASKEHGAPEGAAPRRGSVETAQNGDVAEVSATQLRLHQPISHFWEDVPSAVLPLLKSGSEVHIKIGANVLMVDEGSKNLVWRSWMVGSRGYLRSMSFSIERRAPLTGGSLPKELVVTGDDGSLGMAFALRSMLTGRYVNVGSSLFGSSCVRVAGHRADDAAIFTFVPLEGSNDPRLQAGNAAEHLCFLRLLRENKALRLRSDGLVAVSDGHGDSIDARKGASIEYLLPRASYEVVMEEKLVGLVLSKDLPVRVVDFKPVSPPTGGAAGPGPAELTGRVRVGDVLVSVNGQDVAGIPCGDVIAMISRGRPVILGFTVESEVGVAGGAGPACATASKRTSTAAVTDGAPAKSKVGALLSRRSKADKLGTPTQRQAGTLDACVDI